MRACGLATGHIELQQIYNCTVVEVERRKFCVGEEASTFPNDCTSSNKLYHLRVASEVWEPRRVFGSVVRMAVGPRAAAGDSWLCRAGVCDVARCIHLMTGPGLGSVRAGVSTYYICVCASHAGPVSPAHDRRCRARARRATSER